MRIAIGNDHAAVDMKKDIAEYVKEKGYEVTDLGTATTDPDSYADYGLAVAEAIIGGEADLGILICGTGVGISIAANKVPGIRAAVCSEPATARLVRTHNNANIIAFGSRIVGIETAHDIVDAFLKAEYEGGRHDARLADVKAIEEKYKNLHF
mgnify:CR=1 FL=1